MTYKAGQIIEFSVFNQQNVMLIKKWGVCLELK